MLKNATSSLQNSRKCRRQPTERISRQPFKRKKGRAEFSGGRSILKIVMCTLRMMKTGRTKEPPKERGNISTKPSKRPLPASLATALHQETQVPLLNIMQARSDPVAHNTTNRWKSTSSQSLQPRRRTLN